MDATEEIAGLASHMNTNKAITMEEKTIKHYSSSHRILLVGEGDFSFSACLARAFGSANNIVATSLDSKGKIQFQNTFHSLLVIPSISSVFLSTFFMKRLYDMD